MPLRSRRLDVLVVDDDVTLRQTIALILEDAGYAVQTAAHGQEALDRIGVQPPALVLLDVHMPVLDGRAVLTRLQAGEHHIPVVVMSAGTGARTVAEQYGADGHVTKPFELDDLVQAVDHFCRP
jgi:two-component system, chemotaxis family, chemotaxis protein CheY